MTPRIDELRRLEAAATPRPWRTEQRSAFAEGYGLGGTVAIRTSDRDDNGFDHHREANAALIAAARNALPLLLDVVEAGRWYCRCLEDVQARRVVRGLGEAKAAYESALAALDGVASTGVMSDPE